MDELAKAIKVLRLKDEAFGQYLTASDDQVSVILTTPDSKNYNPKNTEWRLQWLKTPKNLVSQVRLWSIYNKALTFTDDDPSNYFQNPLTDALTQQPWPPPSDVSDAASEWRFELRERKKKNGGLVGDLFKRSKSFSESLALTALSPGTNNESRFEFTMFFRKSYLKWLNYNSWLVEIVVKDDDDHLVLTPSTVTQKISTISPNNKATTNSPDMKQIKSLKQQETSSAPLDEQPKQLNEQRPIVRSSNYGGRSSGVGYFADHFMNALPRWQVGQVYFNVSGTSNGFQTSAGYKYGQYANSGGNVNGSGVQKNGDVSLYNEINRSRDNNAKFVNHGYDLSD